MTLLFSINVYYVWPFVFSQFFFHRPFRRNPKIISINYDRSFLSITQGWKRENDSGQIVSSMKFTILKRILFFSWHWNTQSEFLSHVNDDHSFEVSFIIFGQKKISWEKCGLENLFVEDWWHSIWTILGASKKAIWKEITIHHTSADFIYMADRRSTVNGCKHGV